MSLNVAMSSALSSLRNTQANMGVTSQNVSNAQTPGYTRKSLTQEALPYGNGLGGVMTGKVERAYNESLMREMLRQQSLAAQTDITQSYLSRLEKTQGKPEDESSVAASLTQLRDAFVQLQAKPESLEYQQKVIRQAQSFTTTLNSTGQAYIDLRNEAQQQIVEGVNQVNQLLDTIASVDSAIFRAGNTGSATIADLVDKRDESIRQLAQYMDITVTNRADGTVLVMSQSGSMLVDRVANTLSTASCVPQASDYYSPDGGGGIPPIRLGDPVSGLDITSSIRGGKLGALIDLRDETIPRMQGELDGLAHEVATRFAGKDSPTRQIPGLHLFSDADGVSIPGDTSGAVDYAHPSTYVGFASRIRVSQKVLDQPELVRYGDAGAPVAPPAGGSNPPDVVAGDTLFLKNAVEHVFGATALDGKPHQAFNTGGLGADPRRNLQSTLPANLSLIDYAQQMLLKHSGEAGAATAAASEAKTTSENMTLEYQNATGVSLDDEIVKLLTLQRSYAAASRVVTTIEQMYDALFRAA
ncbi:flagellar hook-associated protein FlgK [Oleisolibacter albus]|uniref:flagellar hook-associated protein FlgK n=1 Tax=Oleisolibacter albus TaxID=2171757 RepID=UPI000DF41831|nr:flagellar hook-associated protein FlgK [Oleisolibacter albus]